MSRNMQSVNFFSFESYLLKDRKKAVLFAIISMVAPIISLIPSLIPTGDLAHTWFQRSGSITVVFGALAQLFAHDFVKSIQDNLALDSMHREKAQKYASQINLFNYSPILLLTIGTLIWGYGDIIYLNFSE